MRYQATISFMKQIKKILRYIPIIIFWWLVWEGVSFVMQSDLIIVSPREAFARLFSMAATEDFWQSINISV